MTVLQEGTSFSGRYRVIRRLATGGMGSVYEVVHTETDRHLALKVMHPHIVESPEHRERFKLEARVAAQIKSEYIVDVLDAGVDDATSLPFLVMELLEGEDLGERLARCGRLSPIEAMSYLRQTALALEKSHGASIIHRDLKPENLFLATREDGSACIRILDFGVAKFVAETASTSKGTRGLGTPLYMSPEQFRAQKVSAATDNFALALMAYTLIVGRAYWASEASGETDVVAFALKAHMGPVEKASERAAALGVALPDGFDAWFSRATAPHPEARFSSAVEMITALGPILGVTGVSPSSRSTERSKRVGTDETSPASPSPLRPAAVVATTMPTQPVAIQVGSPILWVLATIGGVAIVALLAGLGYFAFAGRAAPTPTAVAAPSKDPRPPAESSTATVAPPAPTPVPPSSVSTAPSAPASVESSKAVAPPSTTAPRATKWRQRGVECTVDEETKRCNACCNQEGDRLGPPPACQCLFDGEKWDREHGRGP